jgi:hypothetical protein
MFNKDNGQMYLWGDPLNIKNWTMDNVRKVNYCANEPSSRTIGSYFESLFWNMLLEHTCMLHYVEKNGNWAEL